MYSTNKKLIIIGAGGHGKVVADLAKLNGYSDIQFLDDNEAIKSCGSYSVVGTCKDIDEYSDYDFIVAIGDSHIRKTFQEQLEEKHYFVTTLVHPASVIAEDVRIATGSVVMAGSVINPGTIIGKGCIVNTSASVDHDCLISDYVHISVGAHLAGDVKIDSHTWVGIGAVISNDVSVCHNCMIGSGSVIIKDIIEAGTYVGVPGKKIK